MTTTAERTKTPKDPKPPKAPKPPRPVKEKTPKSPRGSKAAPKDDLTPKEVSWPSPVKPSLMLLPPKVAGRRMHRRAVKQSWMLAAGMLGLTALIYIPVAATTTAATADLAAAQELSAEHRQFLADHAATQDFYDGLVLRKEAAAEALAQDIDYSQVINAVYTANKSGVTFTQIAVRPGTGDKTTGDVFNPSRAVGYLDITGTAPSLAAIGELSTSLKGSTELLVDPYVTESNIARGATQFKLSVGFTEKAMSFKGEKFRPTDAELAEVKAAAAAKAAAEAEQAAADATEELDAEGATTDAVLEETK
jgi:hypothetical protein